MFMIYSLANEIGIEKELQKKLEALDDNKITSLAEKCRKSFFCLEKEDDLTRLAVCLCYAENYTKSLYKEFGIPDDVFLATMKDITIWTENNSNKGLKNYGWIQNHLKGELFRLGRLQFQLFQVKGIHHTRKLPFKRGSNVLNVHIPQGEKLNYDECLKSFELAKDFFERYFPDYSYDYFFCESWLLYEKNKEFMKADSNIVKFQSLFEIAYSLPMDAQAIERIFGKKEKNRNNYSEKTSLQRSAKEYMLKGEKLGIGIGTRKKQRRN